MLNDAYGFNKIWIACGYTDLRYGIYGLASHVSQAFGLNPFEPNTLFLFCGRRADRIKGLVWEGDGFLLQNKRIESGKFKWPRDKNEVKEMTRQQYRWLMEGLSIEPKNTVKNVDPKWV